MGKKSLLKSTSKKKSAKTKTDAEKGLKSKPKASAEKKAKEKPVAEKPTKSKSMATKAKAPKTTSKAKALKTKAPKAKSVKADAKAPAAKKKPTLKELLKKSFDRVTPAQLYTPPAAPVADTASPPFVSGLDPAETDRVRQLLFKSFDLSIPDPEPEPVSEPEPPAAEAPAPEPEPEAPPIPVAELLKKSFDRVTPAQLYTPPAAPVADTTSPPFVSGLDPAETDRVRQLLFKTFDLSIPDPEPEPVSEPEPPAAEAPAPEPEPEAPPIPVAELLKKTFDRVTPAQLYTPPAAPVADTASPPFVSGLDPEETDRVRQLLFKTFDLSIPDPEPEPEPEETKPKPIFAQPTPPPVEPKEPMDPMLKTAISIGSCLAAIFLLIIVASISNMNKYYVVQKDEAVEIWQGRFAPMGTERIAVLTGAKVTLPEQPYYSRDEVGTLIVDNYVTRADAIMTAPGTPDLDDARDLLSQALPYAASSDMGDRVRSRLNRIDMAMLVLKADIKADTGTPEGLKAATGLLKKASKLAVQDADKQMIQSKLTAIANPKKAPAPAPSVAAPPAAPAPAPPAAKAAPATPAVEKPAPKAPAAHSAGHS